MVVQYTLIIVNHRDHGHHHHHRRRRRRHHQRKQHTQVRSHRSLAPIPTPNLAKERVGVAGTSPRTPFEP